MDRADRHPARDFLLLDDLDIPVDRPVDSNDLRLEIARHDYPRIMLWGAGLLALFSLLNWLTDSAGSPVSHVIDAIVVAALAISAYVITRPGLPPEWAPWLFAVVASLAIAGLMAAVLIEDSLVSYVYGIIAMCLVGPATLAWRPFLLASLVTLTMSIVVASTWDERRNLDWVIVALASLAVSAVLLRLRLRSIYALADAIGLARTLANTDQLTGVLNRHGLFDRTPALWSLADRTGSPVFVAFVDIDGLKAANDEYGHEFGDRMIQAASAAVTGAVRTGDLVARWGGDEFLVIGLGSDHDVEDLVSRLHEQRPWLDEPKEHWPGRLSVGFAVGAPADVTVDVLIRHADEDMYRRRLGRRLADDAAAGTQQR